MLSIHATATTLVYQKTVGLNDFYFGDSDGGKPLGNMHLLGKVTAPILKASLPFVPRRHCVGSPAIPLTGI